MTCKSCKYSGQRVLPGKRYRFVLWCEKHRKEADEKCPDFEYEPGTDEKECPTKSPSPS